jgi:hypothetical protein
LKIQSGQFLSNLQSFFEFLFLRVGKIWLFGKLGFCGWLESGLPMCQMSVGRKNKNAGGVKI